MEKFYSTKEVCEMFKISRSTLIRWLEAGQFPPPRKIYSHSGNRWTQTEIDNVFASMSVADAYKDKGYRYTGTQAPQSG